jgi:hypothetical protein
MDWLIDGLTNYMKLGIPLAADISRMVTKFIAITDLKN